MSREDRFVMLNYLAMVVGAAILLLFGGCKPDKKKNKEEDRRRITSVKYTEEDFAVITLDGYTYYYRESGYRGHMAPTPETLRRCAKEVD